MIIEENFLDHHGVKGMRWGQRRAAKKAAKADKKWQKNIYSVHGAIAVHNAVADRMNNGGLDTLNNQPKYKSAKKLLNDFGEPVGPVGKQYMRDYEKLTEKFTTEAVAQVHGVSPSGKLKATLDTKSDNWNIKISRADAQHANIVLPELVIELNHDDRGQITSARGIQDTAAQSAVEIGRSFLEHHGVKGQRWGVRRRSGSGRMSTEAKRSHEILTKAKTHGHKALTNKELGDLNKRLQLEQQFHKLNPAKTHPTKKVTKFIGEIATTTMSEVAKNAAKNHVKTILEKSTSARKQKKLLGKAAKAASLPSDAFVG